MKEEKRHYTKYLICGCCGAGFETWDGYVDQDQDRGFGICKRCQRDARIRERRFINETIEKIMPNLKPENQEKLKKMSTAEKKYIVSGLIEKGALK